VGIIPSGKLLGKQKVATQQTETFDALSMMRDGNRQSV
jgi:hypothetical protein